MAKRGEIPAEKNRDRTYTYSASVEEVLRVRERVEALGWGWHDAVENSGVSRNVGYTLLRGEGGVKSLRTIEAWLKKKEADKAAARSDDPREAWSALGAELAELGDEQLPNTIEAIREYISAEKRRRAAFSKLLRPTPEPRK